MDRRHYVAVLISLDCVLAVRMASSVVRDRGRKQFAREAGEIWVCASASGLGMAG